MGLLLNLGCSDSLMPNHINVDLCAPADLIADLRGPWPWADSSVDWIRAWDIIEHLPDKIHTMNEAHRVLKRGGKIEIVVPTTDGRAAWQDPTHVSFWNRNSFWYYEAGNAYRDRFAKSNGVTAAFCVVAERDMASVDGPKLAILLEAIKPIRVVAFMPVYNEIDVLPYVLDHMREQGIEVHALDGWSTDGSYELLECFGPGVTVERFPADGASDIQACRDILGRVETLALRSNADWLMLSDADEWRRSPRPGETLADAIARADREGYNVIDHQTFAFFCTDDGWAGNPEEYFRHYNTTDPICRLPQMKLWKNGLGQVDLHSSGGHAVSFAGLRVSPEQFTMKHYPFRTPEQSRAKIETRLRRRSQEEHAKGWGVHYDSIPKECSYCWDPAALRTWDGELTAPLPKPVAGLLQVEHSMWADWPARISRDQFRREGDYLAQLHAGHTERHYRATYDYVKSIDRFGYLDLFTEDDAFGISSFEIEGRKITRDLLDSILEIYFLHESGFCRQHALTVLDIGAGYGRFAHRFTQAFPRAFVYCADAIPLSTEICAEYLKYRGVERAAAISMAEAADLAVPIGLAVNIHSWSECTLSGIRVWLEMLDAKQVPQLFLVPHTPDCLTIELDHTARHFFPAILERMRLVHSYAKVPIEHGVYPTDYLFFERKGVLTQ